jgi:hypothetical protein
MRPKAEGNEHIVTSIFGKSNLRAPQTCDDRLRSGIGPSSACNICILPHGFNCAAMSEPPLTKSITSSELSICPLRGRCVRSWLGWLLTFPVELIGSKFPTRNRTNCNMDVEKVVPQNDVVTEACCHPLHFDMLPPPRPSFHFSSMNSRCCDVDTSFPDNYHGGTC